VASGLLSAITIDIKEGTNNKMLEPGDTLKGREATSIFDAVNEVATDISELSKEGIRPLIDNINTHINKIGGQLTDLIADDVKPMMERLDDEVVTDLKDLFARLIVSADHLQNFLSEENQDNVSLFLYNVETASGSLNELLGNLDETRIVINDILGKIDHVVDENDENLHASISDLQKSLEVVSQNINSIVHNIEGSSRNVNELTREVRENPSLILKSSPQPEKEEN
jgi:phospholipid/cholesterol/gamma-HCH transport system substrate-binding protein